MLNQQSQELTNSQTRCEQQHEDYKNQRTCQMVTEKCTGYTLSQFQKNILCQLCYQEKLIQQCFECQLNYEKKIIEQNLKQKSQANAAVRIKMEIYEFRKLNLGHIKLAYIQLRESGLILQRTFIVFIKGTQKLEGGVYPLLVTYPANYPFSIIQMRTLFHYYHPHIYPEGQLCIPNINPHTKIQTSSLSQIVQSWYSILHRDVNIYSLANVEVNELYDNEFIKAQAELFSFQNPIYQKWNLQQQWDQEDQDQLVVEF